jgi:hypothetical protein
VCGARAFGTGSRLVESSDVQAIVMVWAISSPTASAATSNRKAVAVGLRDDSGKVRGTLLRDERLNENRAF